MKFWTLALLLCAAGSDVQAADADQAHTCAHIADNTARLACYDAAFAGPVVKPTPEFGDRGQLHGEPQAREALPKRVDFKLIKVESLAQGLYRLTMENGQVWVTKQADWAMDFKKGDTVTIQRMALGGFRVSHAGQGRDVTVTRVF